MRESFELMCRMSGPQEAALCWRGTAVTEATVRASFTGELLYILYSVAGYSYKNLEPYPEARTQGTKPIITDVTCPNFRYCR